MIDKMVKDQFDSLAYLNHLAEQEGNEEVAELRETLLITGWEAAFAGARLDHHEGFKTSATANAVSGIARAVLALTSADEHEVTHDAPATMQ